MNYPNHLVNIQGIELYIPEPNLVKPTYEALLAIRPQTPFPFWAKIWASSIGMSNFLKANKALVQDKIVLEIGAGIGLPSFCIANWVKEIMISDHDANAVQLIAFNIKHLGLQNTKAKCLDWNHFPKNTYADVVLLSDINYAPYEFESLLALIEEFINKGTKIIIATPQRIMASPFIESLKNNIKNSSTLMVQEGNASTPISLFILHA